MIKGIGVSNGIGIGNAQHYIMLNSASVSSMIKQRKHKSSRTGISNEDGNITEMKRFINIRDRFIDDTNKMIELLAKRLGDKDKTALILKNQIYLINDPELNSRIENMIKTEQVSAETALEQVCEEFKSLFAAMNSEVMNQRVADIEDMKNRMLCLFLGIEQVDLSALKPRTVIVARELPPSVTASMDIENVAAIVVENGGETSHVAILARALEIPAVLGVKGICTNINNGDKLIVDAECGEIYVNPSEDIIRIYKLKKEEYIKKAEQLKKYIDRPTITKDGKIVHLAANIGDDMQAIKAMESGAEGVGLFRTEFLFMNGVAMPTEDEQFQAYRRAAVICRDKSLTIRTVDIGGDKDIPYMRLEKETNPFLGFRGIRFCLGRRTVFETQLKAILRASVYGNIRIMLPMITSIKEVREVRKLISVIMSEFDDKNIAYDKNIKLGVMIETPAAAIIADMLAREVDFFSIGTNDLIQYLMAVDRGNEKVAYLYSTFNPAVLRMIKHIIVSAKNAGIPVGMCGEAAANKRMIPLLLAYGLDEFSVAASKVLETRKNISEWSVKEVAQIEQKVMNMHNDKEVEAYLNKLVLEED